MAYNIVSSAAWWIRSKIANGLTNTVVKMNSNWLNVANHPIEGSEWNGLEPLDLLRGWKGCEERPEEGN
ncbi:hypothetical protein [Phyllobacterium sp. YR531]|uniref:hypothetical protein n=1 Tax=Phyllobacterium sp. YR531 TaxID=1144343 RepID=UPI00026F758B|nr:hypothetical protein [Phyllobacterium sp. YR531]EJN02071.1 hypothetical protein PMI41_02821 [Phyllobacterium sp. YR531]